MFGWPLEGLTASVFSSGLITVTLPRLVYVAEHACARHTDCCACEESRRSINRRAGSCSLPSCPSVLHLTRKVAYSCCIRGILCKRTRTSGLRLAASHSTEAPHSFGS